MSIDDFQGYRHLADELRNLGEEKGEIRNGRRGRRRRERESGPWWRGEGEGEGILPCLVARGRVDGGTLWSTERAGVLCVVLFVCLWLWLLCLRFKRPFQVLIRPVKGFRA